MMGGFGSGPGGFGAGGQSQDFAADAEQGGEQHVVRMRGLPFKVTENEIAEVSVRGQGKFIHNTCDCSGSALWLTVSMSRSSLVEMGDPVGRLMLYLVVDRRPSWP